MSEHEPLLGFGAVLGPAADLYKRQQVALLAADLASGPGSGPGNRWDRVHRGIGAYLQSMAEQERPPAAVERDACHDERQGP